MSVATAHSELKDWREILRSEEPPSPPTLKHAVNLTQSANPQNSHRNLGDDLAISTPSPAKHRRGSSDGISHAADEPFSGINHKPTRRHGSEIVRTSTTHGAVGEHATVDHVGSATAVPLITKPRSSSVAVGMADHRLAALSKMASPRSMKEEGSSVIIGRKRAESLEQAYPMLGRGQSAGGLLERPDLLPDHLKMDSKNHEDSRKLERELSHAQKDIHKENNHDHLQHKYYKMKERCKMSELNAAKLKRALDLERQEKERLQKEVERLAELLSQYQPQANHASAQPSPSSRQPKKRPSSSYCSPIALLPTIDETQTVSPRKSDDTGNDNVPGSVSAPDARTQQPTSKPGSKILRRSSSTEIRELEAFRLEILRRDTPQQPAAMEPPPTPHQPMPNPFAQESNSTPQIPATMPSPENPRASSKRQADILNRKPGNVGTISNRSLVSKLLRDRKMSIEDLTTSPEESPDIPRKNTASPVTVRQQQTLATLLEKRPSQLDLLKKGIMKNQLFGVNPEVLPTSEEKGNNCVPFFIEEAFSYLNSIQDLNMKETFSESRTELVKRDVIGVCQKLEEGKTFAQLHPEPLITIQVLKHFFHQLPEKIIPEELTPNFISAHEIEDVEYRLSAFSLLLYQLAPARRSLLHYFVLQIHNIIEDKAKGKKEQYYSKIGSSFSDCFFAVDEENAADIARTVATLFKTDLASLEKKVEYMMEGGNHLVKLASPEQLVSKLCDIYYNEPDFAGILFTTHPYFTTSIVLLSDIIDMYQLDIPADQVKSWLSKRREKILDVIRTWVSDYCPQPDPHFAKNLATLVGSSPLAAQALTDITKTLEEKMAQPKLNEAHINPFPAAQLNRSMPNYDILRQTDAITLAQQITSVEHALLRSINLDELLQKRYSKPNASPTFSAMVNTFNKWGEWLATEVIIRKNVEDRVALISLFINVGKHCVKLRNYNSAFAVLCGLNNAAVQRLKITWEKLSKESQTKYNELFMLFDMSGTYKRYREALSRETELPIVPLMNIYPKFLLTIEENNATNMNDMVNFEKMRLLWKIINEVRKYQEANYNIPPNPVIQTYLANFKPLTDAQLFTESLEREPRKK